MWWEARVDGRSTGGWSELGEAALPNLEQSLRALSPAGDPQRTPGWERGWVQFPV